MTSATASSFVGRADELWRIHYTLSVLRDRRGEGAAGAALTGALLLPTLPSFRPSDGTSAEAVPFVARFDHITFLLSQLPVLWSSGTQ